MPKVVVSKSGNASQGSNHALIAGVVVVAVLIFGFMAWRLFFASSTLPAVPAGSAKSPYDANGHLKPLEGRTSGQRSPFPNGHP